MPWHSRLTSRERGYTRRWDKARWTYLQQNPICVRCTTQGRTAQADVVDHITPHHGDQTLFWSISNWQALCYTCHNKHKQQYERYGYALYDVDGDGWPIDPNHPTNKK